MVWQVVVQVGESDFVLCPDGLTDDDLVDVIELIPVFISVGQTEKMFLFDILLWGKTLTPFN